MAIGDHTGQHKVWMAAVQRGAPDGVRTPTTAVPAPPVVAHRPRPHVGDGQGIGVGLHNLVSRPANRIPLVNTDYHTKR